MDRTWESKKGQFTYTGAIMKLPDGRHAAMVTNTTDETGEAVLWSEVFPIATSIATITGRAVNRFDHFAGQRNADGSSKRN